jgi:hypothetical protein
LNEMGGLARDDAEGGGGAEMVMIFIHHLNQWRMPTGVV